MLQTSFKNIEEELEVIHEYLRKYFQKTNFSAQSQVVPMGIEYQDKKLDMTIRFTCISSDLKWRFRYSIIYDELKGTRGMGYNRQYSTLKYARCKSVSPPTAETLSQVIEVTDRNNSKETAKYIAARIIKTIAKAEKKALVKRL